LSPHVREAEPVDVAAIVELLSQLGYPSDEPAVAERLARLSADPMSWVYVAMEGARPARPARGVGTG
jgi:hypothetical protein